MYNKLNNWVSDRFLKPEVAVLLLVIFAGIIIIVFFGETFAPILAGIILAFLLDSVVVFFVKYFKLPRYLSVFITYIAFCALFIVAVIFLIPSLLHQLSQVVDHMPEMLKKPHTAPKNKIAAIIATGCKFTAPENKIGTNIVPSIP